MLVRIDQVSESANEAILAERPDVSLQILDAFAGLLHQRANGHESNHPIAAFEELADLEVLEGELAFGDAEKALGVG
jgi:hypothetical protein